MWQWQPSLRVRNGRIFQAAAAHLNIPAEAILHIGDSASEDVAGARAAAMQSLLLKRGRGLGPLASLEALPALIK